MRGGYFLAYRTLFDPDGEWHPEATGEVANRAYAWLDMISMAHYGPGHGLERGQLYGSARIFAKRWNWKRTKTNKFLNRLADAKAIEVRTRSGRKASVITICNYDSYQLGEENERTQKDQIADAKGIESRTRRSNKEGKEEVRREYMYDFDEKFWPAYPKRAGNNPKKAAQTCFVARRMAGVELQELLDGLARYSRYCRANGSVGTSYVMMAKTWLGPDTAGWEQDWTPEQRELSQDDQEALARKAAAI